MKIDRELFTSLPNRAFTVKEATDLGMTFYQISLLVENEKLEKIGPGIYQKASMSSLTEGVDVTLFREATARLGDKSCVCLWSALYFYGLTEEIIEKVWMYVPYEKSSHNQHIRLVRKKDPKWAIGIIQKKGFKITSIERTLVDVLNSRRQIPLKTALEVVKSALSDKVTTFGAIVKMAQKLGVDKKIKKELVLLS